MDHSFITNTIINNSGCIIGGYIREWLSNGYPSDKNWKDIDVKCPRSCEKEIKNQIASKYPHIFLDFSPNLFYVFRNPYSCNLIKYDGNFKVVDYFKSRYIGNEDFVNLTKNKVCIFLKDEHVGRSLSFEKRLIDNGWKIEYPYIKKY